MHKFGLSSFYVSVHDHPVESFLGDLAANGLHVGEIVDFKSTALNERLVSVLKKAKDIELTVHGALDAGNNICDDDPNNRRLVIRRLKQSIDLCADLGAIAFIQHPGTKSMDISNDLELNNESLLTLIDYGNSRGVKVLIENMPPRKFYMSSPGEFVEFIKTNNLDAPMVFDTGHAHIMGNLHEFVEKLSQHFFMIHITDNDGSNDSHLNVGEGTINWSRLVGGLKKGGFDGIYMIESAKEPMKSVNALRELLQANT